MAEEEHIIYFIMPEGKWSDLNRSMFADLYKDPRVTVLESKFKPLRNKALSFFRRLHCSKKVNSVVNLPFKEKWKYSLDEINFKKDKKYILIFSDSVYPITPTYIKKLKDNFDVTYILFLLNIQTDSNIGFTTPYIPYMDYIFTFDNADAQKNGYIECMYLYSKMDIEGSEHVSKDLYFIGVDKGRLNKIKKIVELALNYKIDILIRVQDVNEKKIKNDSNESIIYNQWVTYDKSLKEMLKCNCILELLQDGQYGVTLRYYEAICYNKKLLTNNKNVVNLPFYDPNYIHVFENPENIDWNWVKEQIPIDYHYDGRFSPMRFIDKVIELNSQTI